MKILTAPSLFASDLTRIAEEVKRTEEAGADLIHFDIMDGIYVPNLSLGFDILKAVRDITELPIDAHMMTARPQNYIEMLAKSGADIVTVHNDIAEETRMKEIIEEIHSFGMMAGIALKPKVSAEAVLPYIDDVDLILVMTVEPGFSGQKFMDMSEKISAIKGYLGNRTVNIEVDGGINNTTAPICAKAGANIFVAGSYAYRAPSMRAALDDLKNAATLAAIPN